MESIKNVRIHKEGDTSYYCAYDVCKLLKLKNGKQIVMNVLGADNILSVNNTMFITLYNVGRLFDYVEDTLNIQGLDTFRKGFGLVKPQRENGINVFQNDMFEIRTAGTPDEPLFCLSDICKALGLQMNNTKQRLNQKGCYSIITPTKGGNQSMLYISEQNLYKVIMRSDKPQAEAFQDWVCGEVLPSIRKTGMYAKEEPVEVRFAKMLVEAKELINNYESKLLSAHNEIKVKDDVIKQLQPAAEYTEKVLASENTSTFSEIANELGFRNANLFYALLKADKIVYKNQGGNYQTYADYTEKGYFTTRTAVKNIGGKDVVFKYLVVTEKGREFLNMRYNPNLNFGLFKK